MGYNLHITKQEDWFDDNQELKISLEEWLEYVSVDPDMRLDNYAEATATNGEKISVESEGLSVWLEYSGEGVSDNHAWFSYNEGNINVKNPDKEITNKMHNIARHFKAKVQGDELEIYEASSPNKTLPLDVNENIVYEKGPNFSTLINKRPWWKFWER